MFSSIYGPGVLNDVIVPGYGITKFPVNMNTFWSLPNSTTRNYAGETQCVTLPEGRSSFEYALAKNFTSPNHIFQWDPMMFSTGINLADNYGTNPYLTQEGQQSAFNWGANLVVQQQVQSTIQSAAAALNSLEGGLANIENSDKLTAAQKATVKALLEEVKAKKEEITKQLKDKQPTADDAKAIGKAVGDLQKKVSSTIDKIKGQLSGDGQGGTEANNTTAGDSATSATGGADAGNDTTADLADSEYANIDPDTGRPTSLGEKPSSKDIREICSTFYNAVNDTHWYTLWTCGTDDEKFEASLNALNENNIIEVMQYWDKNYNASNVAKNTFIYNFLDDAEHCQKREFGTKILNALLARAEADGISDDVAQDATEVSKELSHANISKGIVSKHIMAIYNKIVEKEKANVTGAKKVIEDKKAENQNKVSEKKSQVVAEKRNEIISKIKEQLKLKETPQLSSGLKIETDDNGEFTGYSIEINTPNGRIKATGCTYQELALAIENNGLKVEDVLIRKAQA